MNLKREFSAGIHNLAAIIRKALPLSVLLLTACLGGGGGGGNNNVSIESRSISATADTPAQSLTVGTPVAKFSTLTPSGGKEPHVYSYGGTLPAGLSFNKNTGEITGTPTGTYPTTDVVFSVQDANGVVAHKTSTVRFTVGATAAAISATGTTTAQHLTVGTAMTSFSPLTPSGGAAPYTYSIIAGSTSGALSSATQINDQQGKDGQHQQGKDSQHQQGKDSQHQQAKGNQDQQELSSVAGGGTLPAGLSLDASTGAVTGAPTAPYAATNVVFSVKDANGVVASTTSTVSFTAVAAPVTVNATATTTANNLTVGTAMASFSPLTPSGGTAPYSYSVTTGTLPAGLSLNASTGAVTGTPTAAYTTANVVFSVKDVNNIMASTTSTVSFTVVTPTPVISAISTTTTQSLYVGTAMVSFSPLAPSGGAIPYTYSVTVGTLPAGLSLNTSTGAVTGTPSAIYAPGNVVFSVQDANNVVASTTSFVSFTVGAGISATATTVAVNLSVGTAMASFSPLVPSGGATPYIYSIISGSLPAGLNFDIGTGIVTGTATTVSTATNVVFSVNDANNAVASTTSTVSFTVAPAISATAATTTQSLMVGTTMVSFSPLTPSGGVAPYTYSIVSGTLPAGLSFDPVTGAVTGAPTAIYPTASVIFSVQDANAVVAITTSTVSFSVAAFTLPAGYVYDGVLTWMPISATMYTQPQAVTLCSGAILGQTGWRLPTQPELNTFYAATQTQVFINQGWVLSGTWSSSAVGSGSHYVVDLGWGFVYSAADATAAYVTCVR